MVSLNESANEPPLRSFHCGPHPDAITNILHHNKHPHKHTSRHKLICPPLKASRQTPSYAKRLKKVYQSNMRIYTVYWSRTHFLSDVKNETNKDGSGKGQMTAWKVCSLVSHSRAACDYLLLRALSSNLDEGANVASHKQGMKISKEYEKKGGSYENEPGSENKPKQGEPEAKSETEKKEETQEDGDATENNEDASKESAKDKPKANSGKKAATKKADAKPKAPKKDKKEPAKGTRQSSRIATTESKKRGAPEAAEEKKPAPKKTKTAKK